MAPCASAGTYALFAFVAAGGGFAPVGVAGGARAGGFPPCGEG